MKSFIGILILLTILQVRVSWALQCWDCVGKPDAASGSRPDCATPGQYGDKESCLNQQVFCRIMYDSGYIRERACAETCTDTYDPTGSTDGDREGTYCCTSDTCNTSPPIPVTPPSGITCHSCSDAASCDDTGGTYGTEDVCLQGNDVCKAYFFNDKPYKRECAPSCDAATLYSHDSRGRNGVFCCDTSLCNGPGGPKDSASGVRATLALILVALVLQL